MPIITPRELLLNMELKIPQDHQWDGGRHLYVIGCLDRVRITLVSQQTRALNLAYALFARGIVRRGTKVAVLGAGPAGLTFTQAIIKFGAEVKVFEKRSEALAVFAPQESPKGRYVLPFMADWPESHWFEQAAGLPIANWEAGSSKEIANELRNKTFKDALEKVITNCHTVISYRDGWHVAYEKGNSSGACRYNAEVLILAVGFGEDSRTPLNNQDSSNNISVKSTESYWRGLPTVKDQDTIIVGGDGDGAITDAVSFAIGEQDSTSGYKFGLRTVRDWMIDPDPADHSDFKRSLLKSLQDLEDQIRLGGIHPKDLEKYYDELEQDENNATILKSLDEDLFSKSTGPHVRLLIRGPYRYRTKTFGINRLLLWRAFAANKVSWHIGSPTEAIEGNQNYFYMRYGPKWEFENSYENLSAANREIRYRNDLDLTRRQAWPDGFFSQRVQSPDEALSNSSKENSTNILSTNSVERIYLDEVHLILEITVQKDWLISSKYQLTYRFNDVSEPSVLSMEHQISQGEPFRLRIVNQPKGLEVKPTGEAWSVRYNININELKPVQGYREITVEISGDPDGTVWMPDVAGFPVYANMDIKNLHIDIILDSKWDLQGASKQKSLMLRRDYSEVTGTPSKIEKVTPEKHPAKYHVSFNAEELETGYFYGIGWDSIIQK